jgi:hypothetical protein
VWADVRRRLISTGVIVVFSASLVALPAQPAAAAVSGPLALGQATQQDPNVLAVDSVANGSPVVVRTYAVGTGSPVSAQRWTFEEIPAGSGIPPQTYRVRNVAAGRCLEISTSTATAVIADCVSAARQYWYLPTAYPYPGYEVRSVLNNHCLDLWTSTNGAPVITYVCGIYNTQKWRMRYGPFRCDDRDVVALCVRPAEPMYGLFLTYRQYQVGLTGSDMNSIYNFAQWETWRNDGTDPGYDYFEVGWHAEYDNATGATAYRAYWSETGIVAGDLYHRVSSLANVPGGGQANGANRTFIAIPKPDGNQWDIWYEYNVVGNTTVAEGRRIGPIDTGVMGQYHEHTSLPNAFQNRVQIMDGNNIWRRPRLSETATSEPNTCGAPPTPISWGKPNTPPWCYVPTVRTRTVTGMPVEIDSFEVAKPGTVAPSGVPGAPAATDVRGVHNGVDQRALAECLATDAGNCLQTVPGLAACVAKHDTCNVTDPAGGVTASGPTMTPERARAASADALGLSEGHRVVRTTGARFTAATGVGLAGVAPDSGVLVVTGDGAVTRFQGRKVDEHHGYRLAFDENTGVLLDACLGAACKAAIA